MTETDAQRKEREEKERKDKPDNTLPKPPTAGNLPTPPTSPKPENKPVEPPKIQPKPAGKFVKKLEEVLAIKLEDSEESRLGVQVLTGILPNDKKEFNFNSWKGPSVARTGDWVVKESNGQVSTYSQEAFESAFASK